MTRTVQEVIDAARECISDADKTRYPDASLIRFTREALNYLFQFRPDLFIGSWAAPSVSEVTDVLPVPDQLFQPIAHFVAGYAELKDDEYAVNGRASTVLGLAERYLK